MTAKNLEIVIFGGAGDLSKKKILPALFDLHCKEKLPKQLKILGVARSKRTDAEYRTIVEEALSRNSSRYTNNDIKTFLERCSYLAGDLQEDATYHNLKSHLKAEKCNTLFYLAIPPEEYETTAKKLHQQKVVIQNDSSWARILVEKPFGCDYASAKKLDTVLAKLFSENQLFRIDHYLAKEAVQNLLVFRFANTLFTAPWSNKSVKHIEITMKEEVDVEGRGHFYDTVGALRDVGQNHLLQLLALVTMSRPKQLSAEQIRKERENILKKLQPISAKSLPNSVIRGQYIGYKKHKGVGAQSTTETYFSLRCGIDNKKWRGVPFILTAGKALNESTVTIKVTFKDIAEGPFDTSTCDTTENYIEFVVSPQSKLTVGINTKQPGLALQLEQKSLSLNTLDTEHSVANSYEKVLLDCIKGDQTLFTSSNEVLFAWKFITPILNNLSALPLETYQKGTEGPSSTLVV